MLQSATVNGVSLVLTYDEDLDETSEPAPGAFTVSVAGATRALATTDPVAVSGKTVTLTLASAVTDRQTVTVTYTVPTDADPKPLRDGAQNNAAALTGQAVTNNTAANEAPAFTAGLVTTLSIAENSALKTDVGSPFTATDADTADTLTYTLEGTDAGSFSITDKGQIQTNAHIDYEAKASRSVTVKVSDGKDSATLAVTVDVADEDDTGEDISLTPSSDDPEVARKSQATYSVRMEGNWSKAVTPAGVPPTAHFTTLVGGIHNDQATFLEAGEAASAGIEAMAEAGTIATLMEEVNDAKPDVDRSMTIPAPGITGSSTQTDVVFTSDHPRLTLTSMIAPTPDWFVGVSGLSLLDSSGDWRDSVTVNLYPWDAGTEDGTGFSLTNDETDPQGVIASIRGRGQFTGARIARLVFTRTGTVQLAPAAPAGFALALSDGAVTLGWTVPAAAGITGHEYRQKAGGDYGAWTAIPTSAPSEANEDSFTVTGLSNGTLYTFQLRAVNAVGGGVSSAEVAATPNAPASGTVTITGTAEVGQTLTVSVSGVTDGDGVPSDVTYTYQWVRVDGTDESDISDATSSTYTLVADDQGKKVMVKVSFTDNTGTAETLTSEAYPSGADTVAADTTEPMLQSATVTGDSLVLTYDEDLDSTSEPEPGAFTVTVDSGDGAEPSMVDVSGKTVTLTLAAAVTDRQTVTLTYRVPTGTDPMPIRDGAQINAAALTDQEVTNNTDDTTPPMLQSATVDGASLVLTYDEDLDSTSEPEPGAFTVSVAGATRALATTDPVTVSGKTVTVTLASAVTDRQTVTLTYRVPTGTDPMPIRDGAQINAAALTGQAVTNETPDTTVPAPVSASVAAAGTSLTIVFDETLDAEEANLPAAARFAVRAGDGARFTVGSVTVSGTNVTLGGISPTIKQGQTITLAYADPNPGDDDPAGVVQDGNGNDAADFTTAESGDGAVVNLSAIAPAEPGAPTGLEAEGAGSDRIVLTWDAPADTGGRVITGYLIEVSEDGDSGSWTELVEDHREMADGRIVTEYTHSDLDPGDRRHYRVAARNAPGAAGLGPVSAVADATAIPPGAPDAPTELTATAGLPTPRDGTTLIDLAWMKPADEGDSPITSYRIEWSADGTSDWKPLVANHDTMAGSEIVTGYSDTGLGSETTRHYRVFATNGEGTGLASNVADTTTADIAEPVLQSATVNGVSLVLTYDEDLDETSEPAPGAFTVSVAGATRALATTDPVAVSGKTVTLTLASAVTDRQTVTVTYTVPTDADPKPLRDGAQNNAAALTGQAVTNNTAANEAPVFTAGLVTTLSIAENSALKTDVGSPFTATDADTADTLTYTLEGTDAGSFSITDKGQLQTNAHIDYEAKASRSVTVKVSDGKDSATLAVTVDVADEDDTGEDISLTPSSDDPEVARKSQATYSVRMEGNWSKAVTPAGVPPTAHFTTLVGGIHNDQATFLEAGEAASAGIEAMAEAGTIATLMEEVNDAKPDVDRSMTIPAPGITGSSTQTDVVFTSDHPRLTLTSMIAPTPDWFVGVSGLSLLDSSGNWRDSVTVNLYPWDAGTEDGTGFSLTNDETDPQGVIASIRGRGQFTGARIARLVFTRTGTVQLAPAAPAGFALTASDGAVTLGWTVPAAAGITGHEYRQKAGSDYGAWTAIPTSAPSEANEDSFTVSGLDNGTSYTFQLRAVNAVGGGVSSAEVAATPNAPASGTVTITGTAEVGQTLTVSVSGVTDSDGVPSDVTYTYQWVQVDGTDETDIAGATSSTYTLVADDQGKKVKAKVSFTDNTGTAETLTSEAYPSGSDTVAADTTEPMLQSATVTGDSLVLTYDEDLDSTSKPEPGAFTVTVDSGDGAEPSMVDVSGKTVTLTLAAAVTDRQTVTLTYRVPTGTDPMPIRDGAQINAAALTGQAATNDTPDRTVPALSTATVNGASLVLTYDEDLDEDSEPPTDAFTVSVDSGDGAEPSMVDVSGKAVTLTLAAAVTDRQTVTLTYRVPTEAGAKPIRDGAENNAAALSGQAVTNESADTTGPEYVSASVAAAGTSLTIVFNETLADASASLPAPGAFTVRTGDGVQIAIDSVSVTDTVMTLSAASTSPTIKTGQTVTVTYTDPSAADDAAAIQDEADNDAASFTLGPGQTVTVTNGSTVPPTVPGAPTDLAVQGVGGDRIALTWTKPRDTGGRAISSYFIEVSEDGGTEFSELVPDHNTMVGGEIALRYLHTGLEATDVRHYRVSAKNSVGTGTASITAMGQPVEPIGRVDIAFDTPAATEGTALGWTVTATTLADEQPQSDFALRVAVASEADTAGDADYTRVAETVSFARSDFARRSVGGQMRWVAEKTGQVTTNDDVEVEATETFALTATVTNIVQSRFLTGTGRAEGSIEDNDTWTIEVIADPTSVAEGESRDVKLTARIAPASTECVVPFPVTVSLSATGTATSGTDYRLNGETNDQEIAPCTAETSWQVTMTSNVDTADDDGETVVFTPEIAGTPAIAPEPFQPATVTLRETRGVLLSALSLNAEEGRSTTYTMVLTSRPTGTVTVRPEVSGDMDVTVSPASLAFTPGDWNVRQTVKVHAAPDADEDDDAAEVSHQVSGADYGTNRVSAGNIAISVQDDDATFGELTVGVLVGDAHNSSAAAAPRVHFGEPFTIKLWWSEIRTREWEKPQLAIGADRAIRVTGADVTPVKDDMTDTWSRTSLRLKFTPHGTDDVTLVIEPLDCTRDEHGRYNRHAICGWVGSDRGGNTGLTERVRWTARGIAGAPAAPTNVTVSPGHRVHREQYQVAFDAEPAATRYRVQIQDAGGSWSSPRTLTDDASGRREEVAIEGVSHAQDYDVRVRWENRFGESPWVTVHTSDTLAPPQPTGLTLTQDDDGHSVSLAWTPDTGGTTARYQYRVADEWTDIAQSGPGEANRRAYTVGGLSHTWKMEAQVRGVGPTGRTGEPSETAKVAYTPPHVMEARIRMASSPGSEGHYGVGDRMLVAVPMNRPVRRSGPLPTLDLQIGSTTHALALSRREPSQLASGVVEVPETAVTLYFAHTVTKHDEDTDGVSIPANGLSLNAGQLLDATEDGNNRRATFTLSQPKHFAAHKVQGVHAEVERIEWLENRVWVHYNRDLAPAGWESTGAYIERQFNPTYSVSRPLDRPVLDARIVRGRGWGTPCRHAERGCRTVQLTLRGVVRGNPVISSRATHDAPAPDEQAWMSYAPDPHLEQFRLRDAVGNQVPAFTRIEARHLAAGTDSVLSVASAAGREGRDEAIRFTVRMVPAATSQVTVDYATREGTATANVDYTHVSGTLVFEPGQTAKTIDVPIENDTAKDSGETFTLTLGNPSGARLGDDEALGTIWNDEILSATFDALPDNHDGTTAFTFNLAFSEEIAASANTLKDSALSVAGGTVTEVEQTDAASTRRWSVTVEPWGAADVTIAIEVTQSCEAIGAICTSDDLELEERTQAIVRYTIGTVEIAGVPQVGRTLEASLSPAPGGTVTWQWLRGGVEIAGADASAYTPVAADVGARLAVRAGRGGAAATSEATAPVWPAPVNPPLGAGEEELLSAVLTLEAWHGFTLRVAGYGRVPDSRFGEMDGTAFEDGGTPRAVSVFAVNGLGTFVLATGAAAPRAAGLVAYWNGHRIAGLEAETAGGVAVLSGPTPQPRAAYLRYMDGSSDGVRVAVSLRRTRAAVRVTGAAVTSGPGDNGTWDADEHVEAEVRFSAPVTVTGPEDAAPTLGIALDGTRREAAYTGGSGTGTLSFRYTIAEEDEEDEGAKRARIVADGLSLNGAAIVDGEGRAAGLGFSVAPWVAAVAVEPDASGDGSWTPGETIGVRLTFSEAVTVAGGNPWLDVRIGGFARPLALGYASGSGSATLVFSMEVPRGARALTGIAAVADSLVANGAAIASEASGIAADLRHDGTDRIAARQQGEADPLSAELRDLPDGHGANPFTFELRFSEEFPLGDGGLRDAAFEVTNGAVASVERATAGENRAWNVTVTPSGGGAVTVALPATTDCAAEGAICAPGGRKLAAVSATVPETAPAGTPFRVRLEDVPEEHDGESAIVFEVAFTKEPHADYSYKTLRDYTLRIRQGGASLAPKVRRLNGRTTTAGRSR